MRSEPALDRGYEYGGSPLCRSSRRTRRDNPIRFFFSDDTKRRICEIREPGLGSLFCHPEYSLCELGLPRPRQHSGGARPLKNNSDAKSVHCRGRERPAEEVTTFLSGG